MGLLSFVERALYAAESPEQKFSLWDQRLKQLAARRDYVESRAVSRVIALTEALNTHIANFFHAAILGLPVEGYREDLEQIRLLCADIVKADNGPIACREYYRTPVILKTGGELKLGTLAQLKQMIEEFLRNKTELIPEDVLRIYTEYIESFLKAHRVLPGQ